MNVAILIFTVLASAVSTLAAPNAAASVVAADGAAATPNIEPITNAVKKAPTCCGALSLVLPGKVFTPDGAEYQAAVASFWSRQEQEVQPACFVIPQSTTDVSFAVGTLNLASILLRDNGCKFAVRSGGHTPFAGSANIQGGVTIDLSKLNEVDVSNDQTSVSIGPGNTWESVYLKLDALDISTSGGRASTVGVGGLTLGGGFSFFSPRFGLVCDNVINFEVVLASGLVVNANLKSFPDLFKALKGGSNNFGVVTRIDMKSFPQGKFWGGFIGQDISTRFQQFQYFETFAMSKNYDPYATIINSYSFNAVTGWIIASDYEYTKPIAYPPVFKQFTDLPQTFNTMRISNLTDFTIEIDARNPSGSRETFVTATYKNSAIMQAKFFNLANATLQPIQKVPGLVFSLSFQPEPEPILAPLSAAEGGNSLGLTPSDGDLVNVLLTIQWSQPSDDATIKAASQSLFNQAETFSKANGFYNPYLYLNYAAEWQDPLSGYGQASLNFLKQVSKRYDPRQLFQEQVPGGFKLVNAGRGAD